MNKTQLPRKSNETVVIVGGGASGTLVALRLLTSARQVPLNIVLIDKDSNFARGLAYGPSCRDNILNVPVQLMGAFEEDPRGFFDWSSQNGYKFEPGEYVQRRIYGDYLSALLENYAAQIHPESTFQKVGSEVADISVVKKHFGHPYVLKTAAQQEFPCDSIVLALGIPQPETPTKPSTKSTAQKQSIYDCWSEEAYHEASRLNEILLVGCGLSAIDTVNNFESLGFQGKYTLISRRGLLPLPHARFNPLPNPELIKQHPPRLRSLVRWLRTEGSKLEKEGGNWRALIDALRPHTPKIWNGLSVFEKNQFLRHVQIYWDIHRHRVAKSLVDILEVLKSQGRLKVMPARMISCRVASSPSHHCVDIRMRRQSQLLSLNFDRVVNCTGPGKLSSKGEDISQKLVNLGLARFDPLGIGIESDAATGALIEADGSTKQRIYTLGPPKRGQYWETLAIREIRSQAKSIADDIFKNVVPRADGKSATTHAPEHPPKSFLT